MQLTFFIDCLEMAKICGLNLLEEAILNVKLHDHFNVYPKLIAEVAPIIFEYKWSRFTSIDQIASDLDLEWQYLSDEDQVYGALSLVPKGFYKKPHVPY